VLAILFLLCIHDVVGMNSLRVRPIVGCFHGQKWGIHLIVTCAFIFFDQSRNSQVCDTFKACYLINIQTRDEFKLTESDIYKIDPGNSNGYSIRCDVKGVGGAEMNVIKFFYNNVVHDEFDANRYMNGDSYGGAWINPVPYLQTCGRKHLVVEGHTWTNLCFTKEFIVNMVYPDGSCNPPYPVQSPARTPSRPPTPVNSPVKQPIKAPVNPPVNPPTIAHVKLTKVPTNTPVKPPRKPQTSAPVMTPVKVSTQTETPVNSPTFNQTTHDMTN
jgi:hypothetical protein